MSGDYRELQMAASSITRASIICLSSAFIVFSARAETELTERAAIEMALSRSAFGEAEEARLLTAQSAVTEAELRPNPVLALGRERLNDSSEASLQLAQTFDLSGRRALRREASSHRLRAARFEGQDRRLATITDVRRAFAETLYRDRTRAALAAWLKRVDLASATVSQLSEAGEVSGYDRRRIQREVQAARARLQAAAADYARAKEFLAGLIGQPNFNTVTPAGELSPEPIPPLDALLATLQKRPDLAGIAAQVDAFDSEQRAAERQWIPDPTLGVGGKHTDDFGRDDNGIIFSIALPLPVFDRGQASEQRARAQAATLRAERELRLARAEAELRGSWHQAAELREAASTFRSQALTESRELSSIAESAYRGGEGTILELLDAYRTELEAQTTLLDLELRAHAARIELDVIAGVTIHD
jgi:cobalt-zinc-cadmium efflux system outer membrane protein